MRYRTPIPILAILAALACSSDHDARSAEAPDPLENAGELSQGDTIWQTEPEPALVLGMLEGPEEHLFFQIRGATRLSTGTIVVLDGASRQLRAFSPDGAHLWTAGGPGEGPGEMRNPTHLESLPGDTLQVQDGLSRIRYAADGALIAHERLAAGDLQRFGRYYASECPVPSFVGDRVIACSGGGFDAREIPRVAGPWRGESELAVLPWNLDSIAPLGVFLTEDAWALPPEEPPDLPAGITLEGGTLIGREIPPMSRKGLFAVGGWPRRLVVADSWGDMVQAFSLEAERPRTAVAFQIRNVRRPATPSELMAAWEAASVWSLNSPQYIREHLPAPDSIPNVDRLVVDDLGMVWVGSYGPTASATRLYHVYDLTGRFLARVTMPTGLEILEIGAGHLLGRTRDELDVERVVLLNLARSP